MIFGNRVALLSVAACVLLISGCGSEEGPDASATMPAGPALTLSAADLAAALQCPDAFSAQSDPVLLINGTWSNPDIDWAWSYVPALTAHGYDVCTVDLDGSLRDIQETSEYVVHAIREIAARSGRSVSLVGFSQGSLQGRWVIRWWPDIRELVSHYISLAGVHHGVPLANPICTPPCSPALWQMRAGSMFLGALNAGDATPGELPYTSIWSTGDTTAEPPTSILEGAASIALQDICPGRKAGHTDMLSDAIAFALVLDALSQAEPASAARIDTALCEQSVAQGMDEQKAATRELDGLLLIPIYEAAAEHSTSEPELAEYAR